MRKQLPYLLLLPLLFTQIHCSSTPEKQQPTEVPPSSFEVLTKTYEGKQACYLLYDMKKDAFVEQFNPERCKQQTSPCSTFKVPLAVMAFDDGVLKDANTLIKWDGKKRFRESWNHDQTASSWMKESVVWYSQIITKKMGRKKVQGYLTKFDYGNHDFSGGLTDAWLTSSSREKVKSSVQISGYQQIEFLKKLWTSSLPASPRAMELTRQITFLENTPGGFKLSGKTGSGYSGPEFKGRLGWFVAHIEGNDQEYLVVSTFSDENGANQEYGGFYAKSAVISALKARGLY